MTATRPIRVVYDCVVFLQGAGRRTSPSRKCLDLIDTGMLQLCLSPDVLAEIDEVIHRPELRRKFPLLDSAAAQALLRTAREKSLIFAVVPKVFALPRDPDDEPYADLAIAAEAKYLVTWNYKHLTYLMAQDTPEGVEFCRRFPALKIVDPPTLLREVERTTAK